MKKKTKKTYRVRCDVFQPRATHQGCLLEVNTDTSREVAVMVVATKPEPAIKKAEQELLRQGFFYAWAKDCTELDENGLPVFAEPNK